MASAGVVNISTPIRPQAGQLFHADLQKRDPAVIIAQPAEAIDESHPRSADGREMGSVDNVPGNVAKVHGCSITKVFERYIISPISAATML
jgi:hypothetical protein